MEQVERIGVSLDRELLSMFATLFVFLPNQDYLQGRHNKCNQVVLCLCF